MRQLSVAEQRYQAVLGVISRPARHAARAAGANALLVTGGTLTTARSVSSQPPAPRESGGVGVTKP